MSTVSVSIRKLAKQGIEVLPRGAGTSVALPRATRIEAPASLKWTQYENSLELGAFSYQVSGYCAAARIGRYCSFGEEVQDQLIEGLRQARVDSYLEEMSAAAAIERPERELDPALIRDLGLLDN